MRSIRSALGAIFGRTQEKQPAGFESPVREKPALGVKVAIIGDGSTSAVTALLNARCDMIHQNSPAETDLVLIGVSCLQGVGESTLGALDRVAGQEVHRMAILLTEVDAGLDPDLIELVEMETRHVLSPIVGGDATAEQLYVLRTDDRELGNRIKALAESPREANQTRQAESAGMAGVHESIQAVSRP